MSDDELTDRRVYLEPTRMRIRFQQINATTYEVYGDPAPDGYEPPEDEERIPNQAALDRVFAELGLVEPRPVQSDFGQLLGSVVGTVLGGVASVLMGRRVRVVEALRSANRSHWHHTMHVREC